MTAGAQGQEHPPYPASGPYPGPGRPYPGPLPGPAVGAARPAVPPPPRESWRPPRRVERVDGTPFGVVYLDVPPLTSGLAVGALAAGIAALLVSVLVICFGVAGAQGGWGGWAAGAFALLGGIAGAAGLVLGEFGRRQIRRAAPPPAVRFTGRGLALSGLICAAVGLGLTALGLGVALLLQFS
nr:hypothetical protein [Micromonospora sp. DSM 115978]